jgi:hypothetical protein
MEINTDKTKTLVVGNQLNDCVYQVYICVGTIKLRQTFRSNK